MSKSGGIRNFVLPFLQPLLEHNFNFFCSIMDDLHKTYLPDASIQEHALVKSMDDYKAMHNASISDPESFWRPISEQFFFKSPPQGKFLDFNFDVNKGPISIKWMEGAVTNICFNSLDRNVQNGLGDKVAFYW